jgi:transposase InsO family protein
MVRILQERYGYSVKEACQLMDLPRSSFYYQSRKPDESQFEQDLKAAAGKHPRYGSRRLMHQLRRAPYRVQIGRYRIRRLMRQCNLLQPSRRKQFRTTNSNHPYPRFPNLVEGLTITHPDQVWVSDITYIRLKAGFVFLAIIMDVYTRAVRGWNLSRSLDSTLTLEALHQALQDRVPEIHHSDQGVQYASEAYVSQLQQRNVQISMAAIGEPRENGFAERMMRTIKEEEVDLSDYLSFADVRNQMAHFLEVVYNQKRIHSSLGYLTPREFEVVWQITHQETGYP